MQLPQRALLSFMHDPRTCIASGKEAVWLHETSYSYVQCIYSYDWLGNAVI